MGRDKAASELAANAFWKYWRGPSQGSPKEKPVSFAGEDGEVSRSELESAGFDCADELEKGYAEHAVLARSVRHPPAPHKKRERCTIIYQDNTGEFHLMSGDFNIILTARHVAQRKRVEFSCPRGDPSRTPAGSPSPTEGQRPAFVMTYAEGSDEWVLVQSKCECCEQRPRHLTCEYVGKGQQVARIRHSRRRVGKVLVHHVDVHIPPLLGETASAIWCPAWTGRDLGCSSPGGSNGSPSSPSRRTGRSRLNSELLPEEEDEPLRLRSKLPVWDQELESLVLNFEDRVCDSSPRNFLLCAGGTGSDDWEAEEEDDSADILCQHAKLGSETWSLDFQHPLSAIQAFAIAVSTHEWD